MFAEKQSKMPANKNAVIRYMYLDQMLSDRHHYYTRADLCDRCNELLTRDGYCEVSKRTIEMDLIDLGFAPFNMDIDDSLVIDGRRIVRYSDPTQSIFSKPLSEDEKILLKEVLNTLGQFSGLDNFSWIQDLREKLEDRKAFGSRGYEVSGLGAGEERPLISFAENKYLHNKEYLPKLFTYISNRQTIAITYQKFTDDEAKRFIVYPYMLKQYNNRWYLLCTPNVNEQGKYDPELLLTLPLDRFAGVIEPAARYRFKECAVDLEERFEEIIGITFYKDNPVDEIIFAVKQSAVPYIETKPLHETQRVCLDMKYHMDGYKTFRIDCRYNHELLSMFSSYGEEIIVLTPSHFRKKLITRLEDQIKGYEMTKNLCSED